MDLSKNSNKPAYPQHWQSAVAHEDSIHEDGLTKREMFAMAAMNGLLAVPDKGSFDSTNEMIRRAARLSVVAADELLKALES